MTFYLLFSSSRIRFTLCFSISDNLSSLIELKRHELPEAKNRKPREKKVEWKQKQPYLGTSIEKKPEIVDSREEFGHWEVDTVIGQRDGKYEVLLTLTE